MKTINLFGINVSYSDDLNGGGLHASKDYIIVLKKLYGNTVFEHCMEWCAGPGYIGFSILGAKICKQLTLVDINPDAITVVNKTIDNNNIQSIVDSYLSDNFVTVDVNKKFDLIVGNPPHFSEDVYMKHHGLWRDTHSRIYRDKDWNIHRQFFQTVGQYLSPSGKILLLESTRGSSEETFKTMIEDNGLRITNHLFSPLFPDKNWYLEIQRA